MFNHLIKNKANEIMASIVAEKKDEALVYIAANKDKLVAQAETKLKAAISAYVAEHKDEIIDYVRDEAAKIIKPKKPE